MEYGEDLEETEDGTTVVSDHLKQSVKMSSIRGLTVWSTQGEREEIKHCCYHQGTSTTHLQTQRYTDRYRQRDRQTDRRTDRQTDVQTDKQTHRQTHLGTDCHMVCH